MTFQWRYAVAPLRGVVLAAVALAGLPVLAVIFVGAHAGLPSPAFFVEQSRRLPNLARHLAARWSGVAIAVPYPSPPPPPSEPDTDGWHRDGDDMFRSPLALNYLRRQWWVFDDPATWRDLLWLLLNPVVGFVSAAGPALLVAAGLVGLARDPSPLSAGIAAAAIVLGFAAGPALLRLHGHWTRLLLAPAGARSSRVATWIGVRIVAVFRLLASLIVATASLALAIAQLVIIVGTMCLLWPETVRPFRRFLGRRRQRVTAWTGLAIATPYRPPPPPPVPAGDGTYIEDLLLVGRIHRSARRASFVPRVLWVLRDPASWRDLLWLLIDLPVALTLMVVPAALFVIGFGGLVWVWVWFALLGLVFPAVNWSPADLLPAALPIPAPLLGLAAAGLGLVLAPAALRAYAWLCRLLLGPTKTALDLRVADLETSRAETTDAQSAELRRIERDLHDGVQARWVAMGMTLGAIERLMDSDPDAAKALLARARTASGAALAELRALVQGIHPPVLADRGLADAVRTLALDSTLDARVDIDLPGRVPHPVEAAVYFAVSELIANATRHSGTDTVTIRLGYHGCILRATVADDGCGGAAPSGGLRGIQRRLSSFDGSLSLSSPIGGPTIATVEVPCALSSPKTSTCSEKGSSTS